MSTVELDEQMIREYIKNQEREEPALAHGLIAAYREANRSEKPELAVGRSCMFPA